MALSCWKEFIDGDNSNLRHFISLHSVVGVKEHPTAGMCLLRLANSDLVPVAKSLDEVMVILKDHEKAHRSKWWFLN
jgi:hypothetical protein